MCGMVLILVLLVKPLFGLESHQWFLNSYSKYIEIVELIVYSWFPLMAEQK